MSIQREDVLYLFVQFINVPLGHSPRVYLARPPEIAAHMKTQCSGRGHGSLQEDFKRDHPHSRYDHKVPVAWSFSRERLDRI